MQNRFRGFTLIETVIASGILVFAAAAIASLFVASLKTHLVNRDRSTAAILLSDKLEQLKAISLPTDGSDDAGDFKRTWHIEGVQSKTLTVVVYDRAGNELMRCSTVVSSSW